MRFDRVRLENFKCYGEADLALRPGVTVVHGLNGSGKSSLLESTFFALYGARALDRTLEEVVTLGAEEMVVELDFSHEGGSYSLRRRVRVSGDRAATAECTLETPEGTVDGATDVETYVAELLRMDAGAFVNCAYVRQGEVNKLIDAGPDERQDMIDDLLQLGKLEAYRGRATDARRGVQSVLDGQAERLEELDGQIAEKEADDLHDRLRALETERAEVEAERERYEGNREEARETLSEAESVLETYEERRAELTDLEETVAELREKIAGTEREREKLQAEMRELREEADERRTAAADLLAGTDLDPDADPGTVADAVEELAAEREALREAIEALRREVQAAASEADRLSDRAEELRGRAAEKRERADDLAADVDAAESDLADRREQVEDLAAEIREKRAAFEDAPVEFGAAEEHLADLEAEREALQERETDLRAELETARSGVAEAERLLDAGKCPECGQDVDGSPHVDALAERRERVEALEADLADLEAETEALADRLAAAEELADVEDEVAGLESRRDNLEQLADERAATLEEKREQAETLRAEADDLDAEAEETAEQAEAKADEADELRAEVGELNAEAAGLKGRVEALEDAEAELDRAGDAEAERDRLAERRADLADLNDERRDRLAEARERRDDLAEDYDEAGLESAREEKRRAESYLAEVEEELAGVEERRDELVGAIDSTRTRIEELDRLRQRREAVAARVESLQSLHEEASDLEAAYGDLRAELRRRNVETLERMLNETFELVYGNDSYARIELSGEYELTVYQKDGESLDPEQLSGGERALFNLSLRTAVYRLLAEGIDGTAPMPPLILDEPTVFLDAGHVSRLVDLVESMRELGVEQILVVSHDEELVGAAEDLVRVEKDATSNRSSVERVLAATD